LSNNGAQHLAALTKDEKTACYVNLVPSELPGDLYQYVADHVWDNLKKESEKLTEEEKESGQELIREIIKMKSHMSKQNTKREKDAAFRELKRFRNRYKSLLKKINCLYWLNFSEKERRKICKR
jgi:DNA-directed RNA polymerase